LFESFVREVEECNQSKIIQNKKLNLRKEITIINDEVIITHNLPDDDNIHAFLHKIRPFILEREKLNFMRIKSLIGKKINSCELNKYLKILNNEYLSKKDNKLNIVINNEEFTFEKVFFYYINSYQYHREENKKEIIDTIIEASGHIKLFEYTMYDILLNKYKTIQKLSNIINKVIKKEDINLEKI